MRNMMINHWWYKCRLSPLPSHTSLQHGCHDQRDDDDDDDDDDDNDDKADAADEEYDD